MTSVRIVIEPDLTARAGTWTHVVRAETRGASWALAACQNPARADIVQRALTELANKDPKAFIDTIFQAMRDTRARINHDMTHYREAAAAPHVWLASFCPPAYTSVDEVVDALTEACTEVMPISAAIQCFGDFMHVRQVMLYRDPSSTHGTPRINACAEHARLLGERLGWQPKEFHLPELVAVLGLREGFAEDAPVHGAGEVRVVGTVVPAELMSVRRIGVEVFSHREPGVVISTTPSELPSVAAVAGECQQKRFIVADRFADRTYVMEADHG